MHTRPVPVSPDESAALLADPPRLHARWRALLAEHHHLHGPEAAALLGVPEAALLASATGRGNRPLVGPLGDILAPVAGWGRVLLAARNGLGVHLNVMAQARIDAVPGGLLLRGEQHEAHLATSGIARIDLFEENDAHGRTLSLNWFDAAGHAIGRLFLMSKEGREVAAPHLARFEQPQPDDRWSAGSVEPPPLLLLEHASTGRELAPPLQGPMPDRVAWATAAILCCDHPGGMELGMAGPGVAAVYRGALGKVSHTPPAAHATDLLCKLHARPGACTAVDACGEHGLSVRSADGGELRLQPLGEGSAAWRERVLQRAQTLLNATPKAAEAAGAER
jgi:putative heme iron utilization protein